MNVVGDYAEMQTCRPSGSTRELMKFQLRSPLIPEGAPTSDWSPHWKRNCGDLLWKTLTEEDNNGYLDVIVGCEVHRPPSQFKLQSPNNVGPLLFVDSKIQIAYFRLLHATCYFPE